MTEDFRTILKFETDGDHAKLDNLMSRLDVSDRRDLGVFLRIHHTCFRALRRASPSDERLKARLGSLLRNIERDLKFLGGDGFSLDAEAGREMEPLAVEYIVEGSRLGTNVLAARWRSTADPSVAAATAYFSEPFSSVRWRRVCASLSEVPPDSPRAEAIISGARSAFALFSSTAAQLIERADRKEVSFA